jgi:ribonucleoside-diphosphate reductase alpha chain
VDHATKFEVIIRENVGEGGVLKTAVPTLARYLADVVDHPRRERLPPTRQSITRKFKIARPGHRNGDLRMYVTVGLYPDGRPGEIFIRSDLTGSLASGALDAVAMVLSVAWQHGVPFGPVIEKLRGTRFEPQGATGDPEYGIVTSPLDYVAKWLLRRFGGAEQEDPGGPQETG